MNDAPTKESRSLPEFGDIWKEVDPRVDRYVKVIGGGDDYIRIRTCNSDGTYPKAHRGPSARKAKPSRFNGKRGGYVLFRSAP